MTAVRERLERALLARLRETPDGRPRAEQVGPLLRETAAAERIALSSAELRTLERYFDDRFFGLGVIAPLLRDDRVSEVMVNGTRGVWVERDGALWLAERAEKQLGQPDKSYSMPRIDEHALLVIRCRLCEQRFRFIGFVCAL